MNEPGQGQSTSRFENLKLHQTTQYTMFINCGFFKGNHTEPLNVGLGQELASFRPHESGTSFWCWVLNMLNHGFEESTSFSHNQFGLQAWSGHNVMVMWPISVLIASTSTQSMCETSLWPWFLGLRGFHPKESQRYYSSWIIIKSGRKWQNDVL